MSKVYQQAESQFFCTNCGTKGIPIPRKKGQEREAGHLKKIFCLKCQCEVNHAEIKEYSNYEYDDFILEFNGNNFDNQGNRKEPYNIFKNNLTKEEINAILKKEGEDYNEKINR